MAGKVFFRNGKRHHSRDGQSFEVPRDLWIKITSFLVGKRIPVSEFTYLVHAIAIAHAENRLQTIERATRKDALAQLKAMRRLKDDDSLLRALRDCDRMTFEAVQQAQVDAISEHLWRDGVFVCSDGIEHRMSMPTIELGIYQDGRELVPPYLPMGFAGVRDAVEAALNTLETRDEDALPDLCLATFRPPIHPRSKAGNRSKPYQLELARACWELWRRCGPDKGSGAWVTNSTDKRSKLVGMAGVVFAAAGMPLSGPRLVTLLKKSN